MPIAPSVSRVRVEDQESFALGDEQGFRISGRFDWQLPGDRVQVDSPFELFLQRGSRGQSWRCLLYTSPSPRDATLSRMPSSA